jgi:nitrite reductase/ring-hydroxylating ferredoxin subunit
MLLDVGAEEEFSDGRFAIIEADRRSIGVIRWDGRFFALRNLCPHNGAPLCSGTTASFVAEDPSAPPGLTIDPERLIVICPWHRWEFDAATGHALVGDLRVKTYPIKVDGGRVLVETGR